MPSSLWILLC